MVTKTISELTAAGTLGGTELFVITDGDGNSRKVTLATLKTFMNTDPTVVPSSEPFRGALAYRSSVLSVANNTGVAIAWNAEDYDTDAIWSVGAPTRLTVPTGVTMVRLNCTLMFPTATYGILSASIIKNGDTSSTSYPGQGGLRVQNDSVSAFVRMGGSTAVISVTGGDYFEVRAVQVSGAARDLDINSWFSMEIVEATI